MRSQIFDFIKCRTLFIRPWPHKRYRSPSATLKVYYCGLFHTLKFATFQLHELYYIFLGNIHLQFFLLYDRLVTHNHHITLLVHLYWDQLKVWSDASKNQYFTRKESCKNLTSSTQLPRLLHLIFFTPSHHLYEVDGARRYVVGSRW